MAAHSTLVQLIFSLLYVCIFSAFGDGGCLGSMFTLIEKGLMAGSELYIHPGDWIRYV